MISIKNSTVRILIAFMCSKMTTTYDIYGGLVRPEQVETCPKFKKKKKKKSFKQQKCAK